jgi:hypothetical protein
MYTGRNNNDRFETVRFVPTCQQSFDDEAFVPLAQVCIEQTNETGEGQCWSARPINGPLALSQHVF